MQWCRFLKEQISFRQQVVISFDYQKVHQAWSTQIFWLLNHIWNNMLVSIKSKYQWKWAIGVSLVFVVSLVAFYKRHMLNHLHIHDHIDTVSEHIIQDHNWNQTSFKYLKLTHFKVYILKTLKIKNRYCHTIMLFPNLCLGFLLSNSM